VYAAVVLEMEIVTNWEICEVRYDLAGYAGTGK